MKRFLSSALVALLAASAIATPKIELVLNNASDSFLPADITAKDQTDFNLGISLSAEGVATAVTADAADAIGTITGKYWNDHGSNSVVLTLKVDGPVLITAAGCTYSSNEVTVTDADGNTSSFKCPGACWKNDRSQTGKGYYTGGATTLTIKGHTYMPYLAVEPVDELPSTVNISYKVDFEADEPLFGTAPADQTVNFQEAYTIPVNRTLYKDNCTLIGWSDGQNTYKAGDVINPEADVTLSPVFKKNGNNIQSRHEEVSICWDFQRNNGAPTLHVEGEGSYAFLIAQASVDGEMQDVLMMIDGTKGKLANANWGDWCQINAGTRLMVPSYHGAAISIESHTPTTTTTFNGRDAEGNESKTYTYIEEADYTVDCEIIIGDGSYFRTVKVVLPANYVAPSGDVFTDATGSFLWPVGNEGTATATDGLDLALQTSSLTVGTDLSVTSTEATYKMGEETVGPYCTYLPTTSNAGCVSGDMIEYTIKLQKGLTMTVSSVEFDAVKEGTDNAYFSWSTVMDDVESEIKAYDNPKEQIRRNNNANPSAPLTHVESVSCEPGRVFKLRFYISNVANNKKMSIGNIKIKAKVNGEVEVRTFTDFKLELRNDPYTVAAPLSGVLPTGVEFDPGQYHGSQHGVMNAKITVPVDGPVKFTLGGCQYTGANATVSINGGEPIEIDQKSAGCANGPGSYINNVVWRYNVEEPATLTFTLGQYCPYFFAEACEFVPSCNVRYFDVDGKTLIGEETIEGNSALKFAYGAADVTVKEGEAFRGWFTSAQSTALKVKEGIAVAENLSLYAKTSEIEEPTSTSRYIYNMNKVYFYIEDHEAITTEGGAYHDAQHGWSFNAGNTLSVKVAGKALLSVGNCVYSNEADAVVTDAEGNEVGRFNAKAESDGAEATVKYDGPATTLTITFGGTSYVHKVSVFNVVDFVEYNEETGYYIIPANDANSFLLALADANSAGNAKIFLPNGTYDLGDLCLTTISGNNISIIGESMDSTILVNRPLVENEGIGTTATLLNTSSNLYLQDLTLQNALDYYASGAAGRAVCLQDKGKSTICKNVKMLSYQDTYYSNSASMFYWEDCEIHGTVDYLCGDGDIVYNRTHFVNESRAKNAKSGSDVLAAPYTSASCKWGYVFLDCTVESKCNDFTWARSWGGESKAQFIRTKVLDGSLNAARFTAGGMNVAAYKFKEYQTMDAEGNVISPASNVMNFTHSTGNKEYETILSAEEAEQYTLVNIYGNWGPDATAAQVELQSIEDIQPEGTYLCVLDQEQTVEIPEGAENMVALISGKEFAESMTEMGDFIPGVSVNLRAANGRGGFGPAFHYVLSAPTSIESVEAAPAQTVIYNVYGQRALSAKGICIENGKKVLR